MPEMSVLLHVCDHSKVIDKMRTRNRRRGVAATEFAVCLPVIVLLMLATIEACSMIFVKQALTVAAYEGGRVAIDSGTTEADVQTAVNQILTERRIQDGALSLQPGNLNAVNEGEFLTVTVTAPASSNSVIPVTFYRGRTLSATATMMKEF